MPLNRGREAHHLAAYRTKDEFLAIMSHELRSPIGCIRHAVRFLGCQPGDTPARQKMQALLERQVERLTELIDSYMDVSRLVNNRSQLQRETIDLRVVVNNAVDTLAPDIRARHHQLTTTFPDAPVWLLADPCRLEQVFLNLLTNAAKYTDPGGELAVTVDVQGNEAFFRVRDSGIGIATDVMPHIFDLFKRANYADPRSRSGLGVGLAVVRNVVEMHGGSVTAASGGPGQGSEFTVRLPLIETGLRAREQPFEFR